MNYSLTNSGIIFFCNDAEFLLSRIIIEKMKSKLYQDFIKSCRNICKSCSAIDEKYDKKKNEYDSYQKKTDTAFYAKNMPVVIFFYIDDENIANTA